jgi:hypothetical protein
MSVLDDDMEMDDCDFGHIFGCTSNHFGNYITIMRHASASVKKSAK